MKAFTSFINYEEKSIVSCDQRKFITILLSRKFEKLYLIIPMIVIFAFTNYQARFNTITTFMLIYYSLL